MGTRRERISRHGSLLLSVRIVARRAIRDEQRLRMVRDAIGSHTLVDLRC